MASFEPLEIAHGALVADFADEPFVIGRTDERLKLVLRGDLDESRHDRGVRNAAYLYAYAKQPKSEGRGVSSSTQLT